ncbi:N4 gp42-like protein [Roseovarius Plymouth podovirus 1]|uniref:N4 gp42-like protein n=1 Tax=Roseovarius Plymouth podovirus 1 TaxID=926474 RepID=K4Q4Y9_9CAUD|nr:exonuclease [Roseovarius Plymouth podovirus 1]CBX87986.1 N4 gp42-like protein [Roseovarius Plymouth podovirus 1]
MKKVTNNHMVDLPIAVWLLQNGYYSGADVAPEGELISVTTLMKPTRRLILERQVDQSQEVLDIADLVASRFGHGIHDSIERAWTEGDWAGAMRRLHYPQSVVDRVKINPDPSAVSEDDIPIFLEQRRFKEIGGVVLTGQLDFSINGAYRDVKTTSTFAYTSNKKDDDYILQGSLYRYIMPEMIWQDKMRIEFIFTDWQKFRAKADPNYPQAKVAHKEYPLMSHEDTEAWILKKIEHIKQNAKHVKNQDKLVRCTDEELWKQADTYKYYANPETAKAGGRAQKSFEKLADAEQHKAAKGKGVIVTVRGEVKACEYCPAFSVCEQRKEYFPDA